MKHRRRFSDRVRLLADEAWAEGRKEVAEDLHDLARAVEKQRDTDHYCNGCGMVWYNCLCSHED
jgi:hypothetical protein